MKKGGMNVTYKTGLKNMDMARVTDMLSKTYWSPGIGLAEVTKPRKTQRVCSEPSAKRGGREDMGA